MVANIGDVRALMTAHDALAERVADAARDYADMRRFQMRYIDADRALRALREAARAVVTEWSRVEEGKPDLTFAIASLADVLEGK